MPKEITLDDGTVETVYTADEVEGYKQGAEKNKQRKEVLSKLEQELEIKEGEKLEEKLLELKENANPNFAKYRAKYKAMERELKSKGLEIDDNGNVVDPKKNISLDDIENIVQKVVKSTTISVKESEALNNYSDDDRKVVKQYLDKLANTDFSFEEKLEIAESKAFPDRKPSELSRVISSSGGMAPIIKKSDGKKFTDTEEGKVLLNQLKPRGYDEVIKKKS